MKYIIYHKNNGKSDSEKKTFYKRAGRYGFSLNTHNKFQ